MVSVNTLVQAAEPWASLYSNHPVIQSAVVFAHLTGLMVGGGAAVAADRAALRVRKASVDIRQAHLLQLRQVHRTVLVALAVVVVSGILLFAADLETFIASPLYWIKTGLVFLLGLNGWILMRTGRILETGQTSWQRGWSRLTATSIISLCLWVLTVLAGALLVNLA
jgi:hypothetical protein